MSPESVLLSQGVLGVVCLLQTYAIVSLYRELNAAKLAHLKDAQENTTALLEVADRTNDALSKLHELAEGPTRQRTRYSG